MSLERGSGGVRRTCRLFWCYQCRRALRIVCSSSSTDVFCPGCHGRFLQEVDLPRPRLLFDDFVPHLPFPSPHLHDTVWRRNAELDRVPHLNAEDPNGRLLPGSWIIFRRATEDDESQADGGRRRRPRIVGAPRQPDHPVPSRGLNSGDHFTGSNLYELIEEITQNDRPGVPPAPAAAIEGMPTVFITEAHLTDGSQCPVCKEEFELGEEAREMPCKHVYHSECIVPWLSIHNSCPVCRLQLPGGPDIGTSVRSSGGDGGGSRQRPGRWNPFPLLRPAGDNRRRRTEEAEDLSGDHNGDRLIVLPAFLVVSLCFLFMSFFI